MYGLFDDKRIVYLFRFLCVLNIQVNGPFNDIICVFGYVLRMQTVFVAD